MPGTAIFLDTIPSRIGARHVSPYWSELVRSSSDDPTGRPPLKWSGGDQGPNGEQRPRRPQPVPATLTCGELEENLDNNRDMAATLDEQGHRVGLVELPDVHNYVAWRDAFDPHLTALPAEVWGR